VYTTVLPIEFACNDFGYNNSSSITTLFRRSSQNILFDYNGSCEFSLRFQVWARLCGATTQIFYDRI